jgi:hypothetical protein
MRFSKGFKIRIFALDQKWRCDDNMIDTIKQQQKHKLEVIDKYSIFKNERGSSQHDIFRSACYGP